MVKADAKHDYYADLELPSTADTETIKKQFRLLAKQYHPDRNPGREIDVIPKFQAIQAANEILSDPAQKKRYDAERAGQGSSFETGSTYASSYKKPTSKPPPPPPSNFPPPPKRDPNLNKQFGTKYTRPTSSASAEKFAQFTRAAPQQWDRAKYDDAVKAEALRNLNSMRPPPPGPPPKVPPRAAPTAPRPPSAAASPDVPYGHGTAPGYPGLSRTNSGRRGAFAQGKGTDESPASASAYAHIHRPDRPQPQTSGFSYPPNYSSSGTATSPPTQRARPAVSPLRTSKSSVFEDGQRPGVQRPAGRYHSTTGERTDINSPGLARSASVRNSPTGQRWEESGPFGRPQSQQQGTFKVPPPRHHSSSPRGRAANPEIHFSASETSSSEEEIPRHDKRPKATPRKPRPQTSSNIRSFTDSGSGLTGQFPNSNYNKLNDNKYHYPAPEPHTRYAPNTPSSVDDITRGLNDAGIRHAHRDDVPQTNQSSAHANGTSSEPQSAAKTNATFSAADWDGEFANGKNVFHPTESTSRSRSPNKQPRPKLPNRSRDGTRSQNDREDDNSTNGGPTSKFPGIRHVSGVPEILSQTTAFQAGKLSEDWAQRSRAQSNSNIQKAPSRETYAPEPATKQPFVRDEAEIGGHQSSSEHHGQPVPVPVAPDPMELDESAPQYAPVQGSTGTGRKSSGATSKRNLQDGVDLSELKQTAPFKPTAGGLSDLGELNNTLPFESRAAEELNLRQPPSSGSAARHLNLPAPPRPVLPPDELHLTSESWIKYAEQMTDYMNSWNIFNCKMIDHFHTRQEQIGLAMYHNWITAVGDGASAEDFDGLEFVGGDNSKADHTNGNAAGGPNLHVNKSKKAGYATYMQWLEQDRVCRTWWDVAFDEHAQCMEDLGRVRKMVKSIRSREKGKDS